MILLITPSARGPQCADSLYAETGQETQWAKTLQEGATLLRQQAYSAAVIDQFLLETEPEESDQMIEHLGTSFPVYINFAVTGMERLVREVRWALHRRADRHASFLRTCHVRAKYSSSRGGENPHHRHARAGTAAPPGGELSRFALYRTLQELAPRRPKFLSILTPIRTRIASARAG